LAGTGMLVFGHLSLSLIPGHAGLIAGLLPIAAGSGLLKTAAITILSAVFESNSWARAASFQVFYCGINIGGLCGPLLTGWLAQRYAYRVQCIAAPALMILVRLSHIAGRRHLLPHVAAEARDALTLPEESLDHAERDRAAVIAHACCAARTGAVLWLSPTTTSY